MCSLPSVTGSSMRQFVQQVTNHPTRTHQTRLVPFAPQDILDILYIENIDLFWKNDWFAHCVYLRMYLYREDLV